MEISKQIKKYRTSLGLSQEGLSEKIFVTRQTISNWENDRNYPDIHSLLLLSTLFGVSLDILVKGDLKEMKEQIRTEDIQKLKRESLVFAALLLGTVISAVPLFLYCSILGAAIWLVLFGITLYVSIRLEKQKKTHKIQTYQEIVAFMEGKRLDELEQHKECSKQAYQTITYVLCSAVIAAIIGIVMYQLLH